MTLLIASVVFACGVLAPVQDSADPELHAAVERFYAAQQQEDVDGYLALWSRTAKRPPLEQLQFVFESGDDQFSEIAIQAVRPDGAGVRVRVSSLRRRTSTPTRVGAKAMVFTARQLVSLSYVREEGEWRLVSEGPAADGLAIALLAAATPAERTRLMDEEPDLVDAVLASTIARRLSALVSQGSHGAAEAGFERVIEVARRIGSEEIEGEALQNLGNARYFQGRTQLALDAYEARLAIERGRQNRDGIAAALLGTATVRYTFAEYGLALTAYREALALHEAAGDRSTIASTLVSIGNVLYLQGDFAASIASHRRSLDLSRGVGNPQAEADALGGLGRVYTAQGDYAAALNALGEVLTIATTLANRKDQAGSLLSIGDIHTRLANLDRAREALEQSRRHFEAIKDPVGVGHAWQGLALIELQSARYQEAADAYALGKASCVAGKDGGCAAAAVLGLAFAQTLQKKYAEAIVSYKEAVAAFTTLNRPEHAGRAEVGLSHALLDSGAAGPSLDAARRAVGIAARLGLDDLGWRASASESAAHRALKDPAAAMIAARLAVAAVDRLRDAATRRLTAPISSDTSSSFVELAILQAESGDSAGAFDTTERMRAHDLRVSLIKYERDIARGMTDAERDEERVTAAELVTLQAQVARARSLPKPDEARIAQLGAGIDRAAAARAAQQAALFERLPDLGVWRGLSTPATTADLPTILDSGGVTLVDLLVGDRDVLAVIARPSDSGVAVTAHLQPIARTTVAELVARLGQPEVAASTPLWRAAAAELTASLPPAAVAALRDAERILLVPHDVLWRVPFEALTDGDGWVADGASISSAISVTATMVRGALGTDRAGTSEVASGERSVASTDRTPSPTLLVGAPELPPAVTEQIAGTAPGWTLRTGDAVNAELAVVKGEPSAGVEAAVALGGAALTEAALRERLAAAALVHIAAPFRINSASPLFSPVLLSPRATSLPSSSTSTLVSAGQPPPTPGSAASAAPSGPAASKPDHADDGTLEAREVMNIDAAASAVIFTDGAAMSMRESADQAAVVHWAWRAAGVPAMIVRRWGGADPAAAALTRVVHERLRAGDTPAAALQAARARVRSTESTSAPLHWAGWLLLSTR